MSDRPQKDTAKVVGRLVLLTPEDSSKLEAIAGTLDTLTQPNGGDQSRFLRDLAERGTFGLNDFGPQQDVGSIALDTDAPSLTPESGVGQPRDAGSVLTQDDFLRLRGLAGEVEAAVARDGLHADALRDARYLRQLAERIGGGPTETEKIELRYEKQLAEGKRRCEESIAKHRAEAERADAEGEKKVAGYCRAAADAFDDALGYFGVGQ